MIANFALATFMVGLTVTIHFFGLMGLLWILREHGHRFRAAREAGRDKGQRSCSSCWG